MRGAAQIRKYSGELEAFDISKLQKSLNRAGADSNQVKTISKKVQEEIFDWISSKQIYQVAFKMLQDHSRVNASKYKLKKALMELGPSGDPFGRLWENYWTLRAFNPRLGSWSKGIVSRMKSTSSQKRKTVTT
ncbi:MULTISPECIES: ATP cone domain-containing protein [Antarcticibacterium]|uniref:ATP cone domain-containing protein n=1 Tax=Antarcticibacterium TaxID=2058174 RepID=UPI001FE9CCAB|nr:MULTISPECIES: ATP cone domain-containing protein [Antarcticibacterium]